MTTKEFDIETVKKVAHLARLEISDDEAKVYASQIGHVLKYIDKLNELNTSNVEPISQVLTIETPLREDVVIESLGAEAILAPAPEHLFENYKVPQVIASKDGGEG